jgi:hypothetical protein
MYVRQGSDLRDKHFPKVKARAKYNKSIVGKKTSQPTSIAGPDLIVLEELWTKFLLATIRFGNRHFMRSLKCRIREAEPDELEEGEGEGEIS